MGGQRNRAGAVGQHDLIAEADPLRSGHFGPDHRIVQIVERPALREGQRVPGAGTVVIEVAATGADHAVATPGVTQ
ncbi:hypothetical protein G6F59_015146 [Rhizopus arrhizus]|nr:hypothetical protein G6F59_015146 [Rhizopus arrhizus]